MVLWIIFKVIQHMEKASSTRSIKSTFAVEGIAVSQSSGEESDSLQGSSSHDKNSNPWSSLYKKTPVCWHERGCNGYNTKSQNFENIFFLLIIFLRIKNDKSIVTFALQHTFSSCNILFHTTLIFFFVFHFWQNEKGNFS